MTQIRGYHTTSLLLPDGRVLIAGGRDATTATSTEKPSLQYYSPDYMTKPRPAIVEATSQIGFKQTFSIVTAGQAEGSRPGGARSMTHSFDENQRVVQLPVGAVLPGSNGTNVMIAGGPSDYLAGAARLLHAVRARSEPRPLRRADGAHRLKHASRGTTMDFDWTTEQQEFYDSVVAFATRALNDDVIGRDERHEFSPAAWQRAPSSGSRVFRCPWSSAGAAPTALTIARRWKLSAMPAPTTGCSSRSAHKSPVGGGGFRWFGSGPRNRRTALAARPL